jgi:hypothetical protein
MASVGDGHNALEARASQTHKLTVDPNAIFGDLFLSTLALFLADFVRRIERWS